MPKIGFRDLYVAVMDVETDVENGTVTYQEPIKVSEAISGGFTPNVSEAVLYADDRQTDRIDSIVGYDISLETRDLSPEIEAELLGYKVDANGGVLRTSDAQAPFVALMFRSQLANGEFEYNVLYKVKFAPVTKNNETKGENITFQTPTITGSSLPRMSDGSLDYTVVLPSDSPIANTWFESVYEFEEAGV